MSAKREGIDHRAGTAGGATSAGRDRDRKTFGKSTANRRKSQIRRGDGRQKVQSQNFDWGEGVSDQPSKIAQPRA